ncbi:Zinc/iron permease [Mycena indigotica]|uniref:Zinc/iron permease n=1 Tax=Mycena indigotica TaxID=2126181 RepID=A0A8H6T943_9AGAR|nr:Zinc/iron permease [Mycena indigotica]KAF7312476.1 Zinc/iron permease [Mycena indigotica]
MSRLSFTLFFFALIAFTYAVESPKSGGFLPSTTEPIFAEELEECQSIWRLGLIKKTLEAEQSPVMRKVCTLNGIMGRSNNHLQVFAFLFPFGPAWNSILGTFYISSVPNFILAFIPAQINANTLNTMTAFATGGLLSDVFLHLIPHSFMGEHQGDGVHFVMVEEKRNILIGLGIFVGFAAFFMMEKTLRVLGGDEGGEGHSHSHSHSHTNQDTATASGVANGSENGSAHLRKGKKGETEGVEHKEDSTPTSATGPSKMSAYLNLFGDFVHNITDGLAMAASFYASPLIGATTTLACFAHEIPHEIADYSILIRSGFTKRQAMQSQFLTAVGAFVRVSYTLIQLLGFPPANHLVWLVFLSPALPTVSWHLLSLPACFREAELPPNRTFIGIAVASGSGASESHSDRNDLAAAVRQDANGLLGTTTQLADLVIPFVAGGFLYIGAVAVLPTLLVESKSAAQALREFVAMGVGVLAMFLVAWNE